MRARDPALAVLLFPCVAMGQVRWTKYECNPVVLLPSSSGSDEQYPHNFSVVRVFDRALGRYVYHMWFTVPVAPSIQHIKSLDGLHWSDPVTVLTGESDAWASSVFLGSVLFDGEESEYPFKMWYGDQNGAGIGHALSRDGLVWEKFGEPVLTRGGPGAWDSGTIFSSSTLKVFNEAQNRFEYRLWFSGGGVGRTNLQIGHASSPNGINWKREPLQPVFGLGPPGSWDSRDGLYCCNVLFDGSTYRLWYCASVSGTGGGSFRVGLAASADGIHGWTRVSNQPVLFNGPPGAWDSDSADVSSAILEGRVYKMWYLGWSLADPGLQSVGYATSPLDEPARVVAPAIPGCPPGPAAVNLHQPLNGADPLEQVQVRETVCGPLAAAGVVAKQDGAVKELPAAPVVPAGVFQDGRAVGCRPFCPEGNGRVEFNAPDGSYMLSNLGRDIGSGGDSFTFAYSRVRGDFTLTAHLTTPGSPQSPRPGRHGLMVRQDLSSRPRFSSIQDRWGDLNPELEPFDATRWMSRPLPGGDTVEEQGLTPGEHFEWLRIARSGEKVTGFLSQDGGKTFEELGSEAWPLTADSVLVGLAFSSLTSACCKGPSSIAFDQVELTLGAGASFLPVTAEPAGVTIDWTVTRGDLEKGVGYEVSLASGDVVIQGEVAGIPISGDAGLIAAAPTCALFRRGDTDGDGAIGLTDAVVLLDYQFQGGASPGCFDAADADDSGVLDLSDAVYSLSWQFLGGPPPPAPGPGPCGADSTPASPPFPDCSYPPASCR